MMNGNMTEVVDFEIRYGMMTCNGKAVSKVMGCGMILKMIRDE
jgi:hypothetical protein